MLPKIGDRLRDKANGGKALFTVAEVFPASAYPGMILEWHGYNPSTGKDGRRGQAFTTRDWQERWEVVA